MPTILSTKILTKSQQSLLLNAGVSYVEYNAIQIEISPFQSSKNIENAIFTSKNAVRAVLDSNLKIQNCFCVGKNTKLLLEENGFQVIETTDYGSELGAKITTDYADRHFVFFCGNKRLDTIPSLLDKSNVQFEEIEVYKNSLNPKKFEQVFEGVLFFSPSGVKSFTEMNSLKNTIAFCIGTTTASEAKKHTDQVITAKPPSIENVIVQVVKQLKA